MVRVEEFQALSVYEELLYEELAALILDTNPPLLTLNGPEYIEVLQRDTYIDAGATAIDEVDKYVSVTAMGVEAVDTCCITDPENPYIITYGASDAAGNAASPVIRSVVVLPACPPPSYICENITTQLVCASCLDDVCLCLHSFGKLVDEDPAVTVETYKPEMDSTPPLIELLGDGELGITASNAIVMIHTVEQFEVFVDPGVSASDAVDGNITAQVSRYGAALVDTSVVTPIDEPYVISYSVKDAAGNTAAAVRRHIYVKNPCTDIVGVDEKMCGRDGDGNPLCSQGGLCLELAIEEPKEEVPLESPMLSLVGSAEVIVGHGQPYTACVAGKSRLDQVCDPGADAVDPLDGDLSDFVTACSPDGVVNRFSYKGVTGCGVDTETAGVYFIEYLVHNSVGLTASATRNVTVTARCPIGEELCTDGVECTVNGVCYSELGELGLTEEDDKEPAVRPTVTLRTSAAVPSRYVEVRQYQVYEACSEEELLQNSSDVLCEPGAEASDAVAGDLTSAVLACAPGSCLNTGCVGYEWVKKGMLGCINTSAPVGTIFEVIFTVYNTAIPAQFANASRTIVIIDPCDSGEELCEDLSCSSIACDQRDEILQTENMDTVPPVLTFHGAPEVRLGYGDSVSAAVLQPCASALVPKNTCYASAVDSDTDVTSSISTKQDTACRGCSTTGCSLTMVHQCFPGLYGFIFTAQDWAGNKAMQRLLVTVVEENAVAADMVIDIGSNTFTDAEAQAALLLDETSVEAQAFREAVATLLTRLADTEGEPVQTADVDITLVTIRSNTDGNGSADVVGANGHFSLLVEYTTRVAVAVELNSRRRHLLTGDATALNLRTREISSILTASVADGRMTDSLREASLSHNASLPSEVAGLVRETSFTAITPEVDETAAYQLSIYESMKSLRQESAASKESLQLTQEMLSVAGGNAVDWKVDLLRAWVEAQLQDWANIDSLATTVDMIADKFERITSEYELALEGTVDAQITLQRTIDAMLDAASGFLQDSDRLQSVWLPPAPPSLSMSPVDSCRLSWPEELDPAQLLAERRYSFTVQAPGTSRRQLLRRKGADDYLQKKLTSAQSDDISKAVLGNEANALMNIPTELPARYLAVRNRLLGGLLFYVSRGKAESECTKRFKSVAAPCVGGLESVHYGTDPVFKPGSSLYREDLVSQMEQYYNTSEGSVDMDVRTNSPKPFRPRSLPGKDGKQPYMISVDVGAYRARQMHAFFKEGQLMDPQVTRVDVSMVTFNAQLQSWCKVDLAWFQKHKRGYYIMEYSLLSSPVTRWGMYSVPSAAWLLLHILWAIISLGVLGADLKKYTQLAERQDFKFSHFFTKLEEMLALIGGLLQLGVMAVFLAYHILMQALEPHIPDNIYYDLYWGANFFLSHRGAGSSEGSAGRGLATQSGTDMMPVWTLPEDNASFEKFYQTLSRIELLCNLQQLYFSLHGMRIIFLMMQMLYVTTQQHRLAVVIDSVRKSVYELLQFIPIFFSMFCFTILFNMLLGLRFEKVHTLSRSCDHVAKFAFLADYSVLRQPSWQASGRVEEWTEVSAMAVFIILNFFVLSNIFLAILIDTICGLFMASKKEKTLLQDLWGLCKYQTQVKRTQNALTYYLYGMTLEERTRKSKAPLLRISTLLSGAFSGFTNARNLGENEPCCGTKRRQEMLTEAIEICCELSNSRVSMLRKFRSAGQGIRRISRMFTKVQPATAEYDDVRPSYNTSKPDHAVFVRLANAVIEEVSDSEICGMLASHLEPSKREKKQAECLRLVRTALRHAHVHNHQLGQKLQDSTRVLQEHHAQLTQRLNMANSTNRLSSLTEVYLKGRRKMRDMEQQQAEMV